MNSSGLFDNMRWYGWLQGDRGLAAANACFRLLTRGRPLNPLGRAMARSGFETAACIARQAWRSHRGADAEPLSVTMEGRAATTLIHGMARSAHADGRLTPTTLAAIHALTPRLDLVQPIQELLLEALTRPRTPDVIVRDVHTAGEALVLHVVARAVRAPGATTRHLLTDALEQRLPLAPELLARLDDDWMSSPNPAVSPPLGHPGPPPGLHGAA